MTRETTQAALYEALAISHELVRVAQNGDAEQAHKLNSQRSRLIRDFLDGAEPAVTEDMQTLAEISRLNRIAIESLEARQRRTVDAMDTVSKGQRAVQAYGLTQR